MSKILQVLIAVFILISGVFWTFYFSRPDPDLSKPVPKNQFSTARAFEHVDALGQDPHYVGSTAHRRVRNYIVSELEQMGLFVETQEGYSINKMGVVTRPQNILARIEGEGEGKALLLMSHYDSAMHSSPGASDAASGIATILEGVRAFISSGKVFENDVIILFTDAEELGLNGADLFVEEHPWAQDVGLALNFESRGSGGNSFMLLETNGGNKKLLDHFSKAGVAYPVTNSLAYSVYKMLPNDTDLTVLREQNNIDGFNFAFIDDHFDYHTATDVPENLDIRTLAHQGSYLMPLLEYFSRIPLEDLSSEEDVLFFDLPGLSLIKYPTSWIFPLLILATIAYLLLIGFGLLKRRFTIRQLLTGFVPLLGSLFFSAVVGYLFWKFVLFIYPAYRDMEHGFTYNGYWYIAAIVFISLAGSFYIYHRFRKPENISHLLAAPLLLWIVISSLAALYLQGAAYFIILVVVGLLQFFLLILKLRGTVIPLSLLCLPAIFILLPFIASFPVALGLNMLFLSAILTALLFPLLWPVFGHVRNNQLLGFLSFLIFMTLFIIAHFKSDFNEDRPRPNSLVYVLDTDRNLATWRSYDNSLDGYTEAFLSDGIKDFSEKYWFSSKNGTRFTYMAVAPEISLPEPYISVEKAPSVPGEVLYNIKIAPNRDISRLDLFSDKKVDFTTFRVNGKEAAELQPGESDLHIFKNRWQDRILSYYAANRDTLRLEIGLEEELKAEFTLLEAAYDLHDNPHLKVPLRPAGMIPRPFVVNDATIIKSSFELD